MHNNVVDALCDAALQEGLAALRFNFRGVGRSTGTHSGGDGEPEDVLAALHAARELPGGSAIGLAGYSFGASMAIRAFGRADPMPPVLILVSPPLSTLGATLLADDPHPRPLSQARERGGLGRLLISGDRDHVCPAAELDALAKRLHPPADCVIVDGADHSWFGHEAELRDTAGSFLRWHLAVGWAEITPDLQWEDDDL